jgi:hypothetical protein
MCFCCMAWRVGSILCFRAFDSVAVVLVMVFQRPGLVRRYGRCHFFFYLFFPLTSLEPRPFHGVGSVVGSRRLV